MGSNECIARLPDDIEWRFVMHADNMAKEGWLAALLDAADAADERVGAIFTTWDRQARRASQCDRASTIP